MGAIEPMQVDMPEENENDAGGEEHEEQNYIVENPSLDLESQSNAYTGLAKLYRLQFILKQVRTVVFLSSVPHTTTTIL